MSSNTLAQNIRPNSLFYNPHFFFGFLVSVEILKPIETLLPFILPLAAAPPPKKKKPIETLEEPTVQLNNLFSTF